VPYVGIVLTLFQAVSEAILAIGSSVISTAFTSEQWALVECALYCNIGSDGTLTQAQYDAAIAQINSTCNSTVYTVISGLLSLMGWVGLNNAGTLELESTADCGSCACSWGYTWNMLHSDCDWVGDNRYDAAGVWVDSQGWKGTYLTSNGGCAALWLGAAKSPAFTLPTNAHIKSLELWGNPPCTTASTGNHVEGWIGADRTYGLSHEPNLYTTCLDYGYGNAEGDISGLTGEINVYIENSLCDNIGGLWQVRVTGIGDQPDFSGGTWDA